MYAQITKKFRLKDFFNLHYKCILDNLDLQPVLTYMVSQQAITCGEERLVYQSEPHGISQFLITLSEKDEVSLGIFKEALQITGQGHLAEVVEGKGTDHLMSEEHKDLLRKQRYQLAKNMDNSEILDLLQGMETLELEDADKIRSCTTPFTMNIQLLDILQRKPDTAYNNLLNALEKSGQKHLADFLKEKGSVGECEEPSMREPKEKENAANTEEDQKTGIEKIPAKPEMVPGGAAKKYKKIKKLSDQLFGVTLLAKDSQGEYYAMKEEEADHVVNELAIFKSLPSHENIVRFFEYFEVEHDRICLVLEYCDQGDLNDYSTKNDLSMGTKLEMMIGMAQGVQHLHKQRVVHRDIKPENILLSKQVSRGNQVKCKIADFSIAKQGKESEFFDEICGTQAFLAPEVWRGVNYTYAVDVFSLGTVYYCFVLRLLMDICGDKMLVPLVNKESGRSFLPDSLMTGSYSKQEHKMKFQGNEAVGDMIYSMLAIEYEKRPDMSIVIKILEGLKCLNDITTFGTDQNCEASI